MPQPTKPQTPAELTLGRAQALEGDALQEVELEDGTRCWLHPCLKDHPNWPAISKGMGVRAWLAH